MKKLLTPLMAIVALFCMSCCDKDVLVTMNDLPKDAQTFISTYWPNATVSMAVKEKDGATIEYKVILNDLTSLEFNKKGKWESVENNAGIPTGFILPNIITYINTYQPEATITEISVDFQGYDVELNNTIELEFDKNGNFRKVD